MCICAILSRWRPADRKTRVATLAHDNYVTDEKLRINQTGNVEVDAKVTQEQIVATVQPHDRFQEIPEVQVLERIQVSPTTLNTSSTSTHQEQIVAGETTQNTFENSAVQEQVIVQEIPQAPQVVARFLPQKSLLHPCATKSFWSKSLRQYGRMFFFKTFKCSRFWSGYKNKLLNLSMCWHLQ